MPLNKEFVKLPMFKPGAWQTQLPVSTFTDSLEGILRLFTPSVTISNQKNGNGIRRPFTKHIFIALAMETEVLVPGSKICKRYAAIGKSLLHILKFPVPAPNYRLIGLKEGIPKKQRSF
jgi:hypothetical protein